MDVHLGLPDAAAARREISSLAPAAGGSASSAAPAGRAATAESAQHGQAVLATWHNLLDRGRMQAGEPNLAGTARAPVARMSAATAAEAAVTAGGKVTVATGRGAITVPVEITDMPDRVVWLPAHSAGRGLRRELGAGHGSLVALRSAE
jgi:NADH-quinone oxidoreductase subunit G